MTTPNPDEVTYFLTRLPSANVLERATALRSQAGRPLADPRLLARAEKLLADTSLCLLEIPYLFGEVRWRAAQAVAALRAVLGKSERVELRDVLVPLTANQAARLAIEHAVTSSKAGNEGMIERLEQLRQRDLLRCRDVVEDPAFYREHSQD
jgi:hypothetical protein